MTILADLTRLENENQLLTSLLGYYIVELKTLRQENRDLRMLCPLIKKVVLGEMTKEVKR